MACLRSTGHPYTEVVVPYNTLETQRSWDRRVDLYLRDSEGNERILERYIREMEPTMNDVLSAWFRKLWAIEELFEPGAAGGVR
jgi:hypothetical protein